MMHHVDAVVQAIHSAQNQLLGALIVTGLCALSCKQLHSRSIIVKIVRPV